MTGPASEQWRVEIAVSGRSGSVNYHEPSGCISFYCKFDAGDTVANICIEGLAVWKS